MNSKLVKVLVVFLLLAPMMAFGAEEYLEMVNYKGAFGQGNWAAGWSALSQYGFMAEQTASDVTEASLVPVTDDDILPGETVYWTADNTYLLQGRVFVDDGSVLIIEPGTIIKGAPGEKENASALVVARGGKIYAEGTPARPIIFTSANDDLTNPLVPAFDEAGLWGGVIMLGNAPINFPGGVANIEGIPDTEPRGEYGGTDEDDCSGVVKYVSIRHGGTEIGAGNEINGLTMGGVGRGTVISHVEVFANLDDGFEWFGGTVNCDHLVAAFCGDDAFDIDFGLRNKMQFLFALQSASEDTVGDHCGEWDGADENSTDSNPKAYPVIYNATFVGGGSAAKTGSRVIRIRENMGGEVKNSIFGQYKGKGLTVEDKYDPDSRDRLGVSLHIQNNLWFDLADVTGMADIAKADETWTNDYMSNPANGNVFGDPLLNNISRIQDQTLDPRPQHDGLAYQDLGAYPANDEFFERVNYKGAFGSTNWAAGWTALAQYGFMKPATESDVAGASVVPVTDADIPAGANVYWTADNTYQLQGRVFVDDGATLNIEAGTIVKGAPGEKENASALIVARGGRIYAEGTGLNPIIFTSNNDDLANPLVPAFDEAGLWGGVIMLGNAKINFPGGLANIEGIPDTEPRGEYGGDNDDDCSGVFKYASIRHGGTEIGAGNEINGLTMGGVGAGTTISHVEVFANLDDGFEWFGGAVNGDHLVAAFCGDDAFDIDFGLRNKMQFLFALQSASEDTVGDHCGEWDGADENSTDSDPKAYPVIYNATFLGGGSAAKTGSRVIRIRENMGGEVKNSILAQYKGKGLTVEDKYDPDSRDRLGVSLHIQNNIWHDLADVTSLSDIAKSSETWTNDYMSDPANMNILEDPMLNNISRIQDQTLDPRPAVDGPAY